MKHIMKHMQQLTTNIRIKLASWLPLFFFMAANFLDTCSIRSLVVSGGTIRPQCHSCTEYSHRRKNMA